FAEEVDTILSQAPAERLTALFSATMPPAIRATAAKHLNEPLHIAVAEQATVAESVEQRYAVVPHKHKAEALARILSTSDAEAAIVFVRTRADVEEVSQSLIARGVNAAGISGDVAQQERERTVERLRNGNVDVLVATDVAARGLDVDRIGLVVNYDVPREPEVYVHRIGRTGRAGRTGVAFTFITPAERGRLRVIERTIRTQLTEHPIPTSDHVTEHRYGTLFRQIPGRVAKGQLDSAYRAVADAVDAGIDPITLAAALAALAIRDDSRTTNGAAGRELDAALADLRKRESASTRRNGNDGRDGGKPGRATRNGSRKSNEREGRWSNPDQSNGRKLRKGRDLGQGDRSRPSAKCYWIGVGHGHGAGAGSIVNAITGKTKLNGTDLGRIEVFKHFSLVEIGGTLSRDTMRQLSKTRVAGRELRIRLDTGKAA
ncbi:MAG: DEAD/DEAH box helicase, partial [Propionibacteriaceae bacterium]|nr:DEAD/DEAH box helicase [Propionibacteriaceae bacterium]